MSWPRHPTGALTGWFLAGLVALVGLLAALQYRWLGEIGAAEQTRMRSALEQAARRFGLDFDREITRLLLTFATWGGDDPTDASAELAERLATWREEAPWPALLGDVVLWRRIDGTLRFQRLEGSGRLVDLDWPAGQELAADLTPLLAGPPALARSVPPPTRLLDGRHAVLQLPVLQRSWRGPLAAGGAAGPTDGRHDGQRGEPSRGRAGRQADEQLDGQPGDQLGEQSGSQASEQAGRRAGADAEEYGWLARLDLDALAREVWPTLGSRHLTSEDGPYPFAIRRRDGSEIFRSAASPAAGEQSAGRPGEGDGGVRLFGLLPPEELHALLGGSAWLGRRGEPDPAPPGRGGERGDHPAPGFGFGFGPGPRGLFGLYEGAADPVWELVVWHPRGSLTAAVDALRWRNLAVGFGALLLLAASGVLLLVAARRSEALSEQRLRLVAGITHELRTPLAGIRSLGQNLADGIVTREEQVRRYGERIEREGDRLTQMVEQALALSGLLSRGAHQEHLPVEAGALLGLVRDDCADLATAAGATLEVLRGDTPRWAQGDPEALRRALGNLVQNAIRHAGGPIEFGLTAQPGELGWTVADRGPGIEPADRLRLFEPFFRGQRAIDAQVPGSGLGLALVREIAAAHGGRIEIASRLGGGTVFTLWVPELRTHRGAAHGSAQTARRAP
jgi:signal transduction histidine kinase